MEEKNGGRGRNWRATYLTIKAFSEWKDNDFKHLHRKVSFIDMKLNFLLVFLGLVLALIAIVLTQVI